MKNNLLEIFKTNIIHIKIAIDGIRARLDIAEERIRRSHEHKAAQ